MPSRDRSQCATRPCPHPERLRKALQAAVVLQRRGRLRAFVASRVPPQLRLHANPQSEFSRQPHATPRSSRRRALRERLSIELRDSSDQVLPRGRAESETLYWLLLPCESRASSASSREPAAAVT